MSRFGFLRLLGALLCAGGLMGSATGCCIPAFFLWGTGSPSWKEVGERFEDGGGAAELFAVGDSAFFVRRCLEPDCSELWRLREARLEPIHRFPAAAIHMNGSDTTLFVMLSHPVSRDGEEWRRYQMVRSLDGGLTWEERGEVVDTGPLLVLSAEEVWILSDRVMRSQDGGLTFQQVSVPGERNQIREQLSLGKSGDVLLTGAHGVFRIGREGVLKGFDALEGAEVQAAAAGYFAGRHAGALTVRRDEPGAPWIPFMRGEHDVFAMAAEGEVVRVLTHASHPAKEGMDIRYHVSLDGGRTWRSEDTGLLHAAIAGRSMGAAQNYVGQMFTCVAP